LIPDEELAQRMAHDQVACGGLTRKCNLGDSAAGRERLSRFETEAVDDVDNSGR